MFGIKLFELLDILLLYLCHKYLINTSDRYCTYHTGQHISSESTFKDWNKNIFYTNPTLTFTVPEV